MAKNVHGKSKAEEMIEYVMSHLQEAPSLTDIAKKYNYNENYVITVFSDYFGVPYGRFIKMFQMRQVARELLEDNASVRKLAEKYGYTDLSHFTRAFKRELGMSPRDFRNSKGVVPDMPIPKEINKHKLFFKYVRKDNFLVYGYPIPAVNGINTDYLRECSYALEHHVDQFDLNNPKEQLGFWWSDTEDEIYYVLGYKANSEHEIPKNAKRFLFPSFDYVIFSVERGKDLEDILATQRMMVRYVMKIWRSLNHKVASTMVYTYEAFDQNYTYLYLPLIEGMPEKKTEDRNMKIDSWVSYIDQNITKDLTLRNIAAHFNYSEQHFRRVFKMYYELSPTEYILKRRLYLAAKEIRNAKNEKESQDIAKRYRFKTLKSFQKLFSEEFHTEPKNYQKVHVDAVDLVQYYSMHKEQVKITFRDEPELKMIGTVLHTRNTKKVIKEPDIPQLNAYWMQNEYDELKGSVYECSLPGEEDKIALWYSDENTGDNEYILGPVVEHFDKIPEGFKAVVLPPGKYAVFESLQKSDRSNMPEIYLMLLRCSFYGWLHEYQFRVNTNRLTFVRYRNQKLFFYVPINE